LKDPTEDVSKFSRKLALMSGGEKGQVRKRLTEKPVRWLPPGQSAKLTNFEMMMLRRKGKRIKPAFVLGTICLLLFFADTLVFSLRSIWLRLYLWFVLFKKSTRIVGAIAK
jgi:hypothetical protein